MAVVYLNRFTPLTADGSVVMRVHVKEIRRRAEV